MSCAVRVLRIPRFKVGTAIAGCARWRLPPRRCPIPAFVELGDPSMSGWQWLGLWGAKNLPAPIVQRPTALLPEILARSDVMAWLDDL